MALPENENVNHQKTYPFACPSVFIWATTHPDVRVETTKDSQETHPIQIEFLSFARIFMADIHLRIPFYAQLFHISVNLFSCFCSCWVGEDFVVILVNQLMMTIMKDGRIKWVDKRSICLMRNFFFPWQVSLLSRLTISNEFQSWYHSVHWSYHKLLLLLIYTRRSFSHSSVQPETFQRHIKSENISRMNSALKFSKVFKCHNKINEILLLCNLKSGEKKFPKDSQVFWDS